MQLSFCIPQVDKINPQVAARMTSAFTQWRKFNTERQEQMKAQLLRIVDANSNGTGLSENVYEIASKSLE
jgi:aminopeptidase N